MCVSNDFLAMRLREFIQRRKWVNAMRNLSLVQSRSVRIVGLYLCYRQAALLLAHRPKRTAFSGCILLDRARK